MSKNDDADVTFELACPICHSTRFDIKHVEGSALGQLYCARCEREFVSTPSGVDLTLEAGLGYRAYARSRPGGVELFRNPLVSLAYERGWRQSFQWAKFPGVDVESEMAIEMLQSAYGEVLVDMSCGSGLFSRKFLASRKFKGVIAADYSESMLREALQNFEQDKSLNAREYMLLRADVARLPFETGSVAAIHAGAAIHCWPDPLGAMAEISRVLRPGGVLVASTFLGFTAPLGEVFGDDLVKPLRGFERPPNAMRWWNEDELRDLCETVGLQNFTRERDFRFIIFSAQKPLKMQ